jgi:hypothetical protein
MHNACSSRNYIYIYRGLIYAFRKVDKPLNFQPTKSPYKWCFLFSTSPLHDYYLYYKERRQLQTFLTQIGSALPLTPDPPVICFWKWIGWKYYEVPKNRNLESISAKNVIFFTQPRFTHSCTCVGPTKPAHTHLRYPLGLLKFPFPVWPYLTSPKNPSPSLFPFHPAATASLDTSTPLPLLAVGHHAPASSSSPCLTSSWPPCVRIRWSISPAGEGAGEHAAGSPLYSPPRVPCSVGHHEQARVEQPRAWASSALSTMAATSLRPGSPHRGDEGRRQFFFSAVRSPRHIFSFSAYCSSVQLARPITGNEIWGNNWWVCNSAFISIYSTTSFLQITLHIYVSQYELFTFSFRGISLNNFTGELPSKLGNLAKLEQM